MSVSWQDVGDWIKNNAGTGAALVGSLLTGNVPAAVAAGVSMVSSATGSNEPEVALEHLKGNTGSLVRLKELALQNDISIRKHLEEMERIKLEQHKITQGTIQNGDNADGLVKYVRPVQSTLALLFGFYYISFVEDPSFEFFGVVMALPLAYFGLREIGKWKDKSKPQ